MKFAQGHLRSLVRIDRKGAATGVFAFDDLISSTSLCVYPNLVLFNPANPSRTALHIFDCADQLASLYNHRGSSHTIRDQILGYFGQIAGGQKQYADGEYSVGQFEAKEIVD